MTDPQNPFRVAPAPAPKQATQNPFVTGVKDPQNPFAETPGASVTSLAGHAASTMLTGALDLVTFPAALLSGSGGLGGSTNLQDLRKMRDRLASNNQDGRFTSIIERIDADIGRVQNTIQQQATHLRYETARARQRGETQLPAKTGAQLETEARAAIFGLTDPKTGRPVEPEPGSAAEAMALVTAIPGHLLSAFMNARTPQEQAGAIGSTALAAGVTAAPFARARPVPVATELAHNAANYITGGVTEAVSSPAFSHGEGAAALMNDMARRRTAVRDIDFTREIETPEQRADRLQDAQLLTAAMGSAGADVIMMESNPPTAHVGQEVRPGEVFRGDPSVSYNQAEQSAIKMRLFAESERNLALGLVAIHRELTPYGTTVIPGIEENQMFTIANALTEAERTLAGRELAPGETIMNQAVHRRPDHTADIAIYGDRSPLMNKVLRDQFVEHGYFEGQEVSWNGKNYALAEFPGVGRIEGGSSRARSIHEILKREGLSDQAKKELILQVNEGTDQPVLLRGADGSEFSVMRSELRRPANVEAIAEPFIAELHTRAYNVGDVMSLIGQEKFMSPLSVEVKRAEFFSLVAFMKGMETRSLTTGEPTGPLTQFKLNSGLNTIPIVSRPKQLQNLGVDLEALTGKGTTAFVFADPSGQPVGLMGVTNFLEGGKAHAAVTDWVLNADANPVMQARAALALMEHAHELKIDRLLARVDEVGARLAAKYLNSYMEPVTEIGNIRARVTVTPFNYDKLYSDFQSYKPDLPFDPRVEQFARERSFLPEEVAGLKRYLGYKMAKEGREIYLTPDERAVYDRLVTKMHPFEAAARLMPLDYLAASNDMLAQWTPNGVIEVRARESGQLLGRFRNEAKAREFINGSGQAEGPNLDGGGRTNAIPPSAIGGSIMPPAPPRPPTNAVADGLNASYLPPGGRLPRISDWIRTQLEYVSPMEGWISAIDNSFKTDFSPGFRATQRTLRSAQSPMLDYLKRLHKEVDEPFFKGLSQDQRAMVFRAIETMTPDEVISKGFFRPLNQNEINIANWLAAHNIDTARTLRYTREMLDLEKQYLDDPEALNRATAELTQRYNLDQNHVVAAATFREIRSKNPNEIFLGHITRLADAIMSDAPSRADFIKEHNMPPSTMEAIRRLESILDEVANRIGVPEERRVRGWIAHFRAQMEPKGTLTQAFLGQRGLADIPEMKFLNELARTGEISMVELDPVMSATRYIRGAFLSKEFIPTWNETLKTWKGELAKMPVGSRQKVERVLSSYLSELRGIPEASVKFTEEIVNRLTQEMGMEFSVDFRKNIVNTLIAASSAGTQAFRMAMGLRDLVSAWMTGTSWFGPARFKRMMQLGWDDAAVSSLREKGLIPPSLTPIEFSSPVDLQTSLLLHKLPERLNRVADLGLRASLQPLVYDRINAGVFLEVHELAAETFTSLSAGKIDKAAAYKKMMIDAYEPSFVREFDKLVDAAKYEDAANLLATQSQRMVTPTYGLANHPYKWGTNTGRLIGQFGTWPTWLATNLARMLTRGSAGTRFRILSRLAMTQAAVYLTGKALGFDLYSWFLLTGLRWLGGPVVGTGRAVINLFSPSQTEQQQAKLELARLAPGLSDPRSLYVPGSYAVGDILQAFSLLGDPARRPTNPLEVVGRGIGIPVSKDPSWLDHLLGTQ